MNHGVFILESHKVPWHSYEILMKSLELTIETSKLCTCSTGGAGSPATSRQADLTMAPTAQSYGALMTAMHKSGKWQKGSGTPVSPGQFPMGWPLKDHRTGENWYRDVILKDRFWLVVTGTFGLFFHISVCVRANVCTVQISLCVQKYSNILGVIIPTDFNSMIFQRGASTSNQDLYGCYSS